MAVRKTLGFTHEVDDLRFLSIDDDFDDLTGWTQNPLGTATIEIDPAGQAHLVAGDSGGTNSAAVLQNFAGAFQRSPNITVEFKIKFDKLAGGFDGTVGTLDCFLLSVYQGTYRHTVAISEDSVWYFDSTNAYVKQFDKTFDNVSWWTIRILFRQNSFSFFSKDDGADWVYDGAGDSADPNTIYNGLTQIGPWNYPASPPETEVHLDYIKIARGSYWPFIYND